MLDKVFQRFQKISLVFLAIIAVISGQNCSTYNPCGSNGYCVDNTDGEWTCECKFWWNGTLCNEHTSSGIQVITLGAVVGLLVVIFYGLAIFNAIRKRKNKPKDQKKPTANDAVQPTLKEVAVVQVKESTRCSTCLTLILMLVVTAATLVAQWLLVQPIHDQLVKKYYVEEPLYYERADICDLIDAADFNLLTFPVAAFLTLFFIIFAKRVSCMRQKLRGHLGPVVPLDFYAHIKRTFTAFIFAILADELLFIIYQVLAGNTTNQYGVIVSYLLRIATVLVIGIRYYPLLSAVYMDKVVPLGCATLYAWLDLSLSVIAQSWCQTDFYPSDETFQFTNGTDLMQHFRFYGTGQNLILIQLFTSIPRWFCWSYVVVKLPILFIMKIHKLVRRRNLHLPKSMILTREEKILLYSSAPHSVEVLYVRNLFRHVEERQTTRSFIGRLIPKFIYQWRDDFRFSSRVICVYASITLLLFFLTTQMCIFFVPSLEELRSFLQGMIDAIVSYVEPSNTQSQFSFPNLTRAYVIAFVAACVVSVIQMLVLLANIRRNLFQIYRGDDSEIPKRNPSRYTNYGTGSFQFAGFFIGYLVWGYFIIALFAFIICVTIDAFITFGSVRLVETILKRIIPIILLVLFKQFLNKILARYVFLQEFGDLLAINNRRVLMIFLYFNFFLDAFLGAVSSVVRIVKSIVGGCLYMCRLDYSTLGRKLEVLDAGFNAYCGFIHLEATHRNPIMLAFASYLYGQMKVKQCAVRQITVMDVAEGKKTKTYSSKVLQRWFLAVLLIRNPSLVFQRQKVLEQMKKDKEAMIEKRRQRVENIKAMTHRASIISESDLNKFWQKRV